MGFLSKAKDMYALQKQAKSIKKELKNIHIEAEIDGVKIIMTAEQDPVSVEISDDMWNQCKGAEFGKKKLADAMLKSSQKALKKSQEIAGAKMKDVWGQLGMGA